MKISILNNGLIKCILTYFISKYLPTGGGGGGGGGDLKDVFVRLYSKHIRQDLYKFTSGQTDTYDSGRQQKHSY